MPTLAGLARDSPSRRDGNADKLKELTNRQDRTHQPAAQESIQNSNPLRQRKYDFDQGIAPPAALATASTNILRVTVPNGSEHFRTSHLKALAAKQRLGGGQRAARRDGPFFYCQLKFTDERS